MAIWDLCLMIVLCEYDVTGSRDDLKNRWELIPVGDRSPLLALDNLDLMVYNCLIEVLSPIGLRPSSYKAVNRVQFSAGPSTIKIHKILMVLIARL